MILRKAWLKAKSLVMTKRSYSTFLFPTPSFLSGVASLLDLQGAMLRQCNTYETPSEADNVALRADWLAVGEDLANAMEMEIGASIKSEKK